MWLTSGKCCQKKLIMIIVQKRPRAAETAHRGRCRRRRCLASGWSAPQKLRCWFTTIIWKMKAYFCLEMSTIFFTAASTTSWGITKLRRELCQNALLPINKSKLSALFIFFFEGGRRERLHCFKFIQWMCIKHNFCLSFFNYSCTKLSDFCNLNEISCERLCSCKEPKIKVWFFKN